MTAQPLSALDTAQPGTDYEDFYRRVQPRLLAYVRAVFRRVDAEEVTAETMARALEHFDRLRPARSAWPWLVVVARRLACDASRAQGACSPVVHEHLAQLPVLRGPALEEEVLGRERARLMEQALRGLPADDARLLRLRLVDGLSHDEIAALLGSSPATVRQQFRRARGRFMDHFAHLGGELRALVPLPAALLALLRPGRRASTQPAMAMAPLGAVVALAGAGFLSAVGAGPVAQQDVAAVDSASVPVRPARVLAAPAIRPPDVATAAAVPVRAAGATTAPSAVTASVRSEGVRALLFVRTDQFSKGRTEQDSVAVQTPVGTVHVEGESENSGSDRVMCQQPVVSCG